MTNSKIYIVAEHCGQNLKTYLIQNADFKIIDLYTQFDLNDDYPTVAKIMANQLKNEADSIGIVICGSGQGISIAMNRSNWIRCVNPRTILEAKLTREHNNANCLSFGANYIKPELALQILQTFVKTQFSNETRHHRRVSQLST